MTGRARGDAALWVAGEYQARANIALSEAAAALRNALTGIRLQPTRATREISRNIGRVLDGQSLGDGIHDAPSALSRTVVGELFEDRFRIHSIERRNQSDEIEDAVLIRTHVSV